MSFNNICWICFFILLFAKVNGAAFGWFWVFLPIILNIWVFLTIAVIIYIWGYKKPKVPKYIYRG